MKPNFFIGFISAILIPAMLASGLSAQDLPAGRQDSGLNNFSFRTSQSSVLVTQSSPFGSQALAERLPFAKREIPGATPDLADMHHSLNTEATGLSNPPTAPDSTPHSFVRTMGTSLRDIVDYADFIQRMIQTDPQEYPDLVRSARLALKSLVTEMREYQRQHPQARTNIVLTSTTEAIERNFPLFDDVSVFHTANLETARRLMTEVTQKLHAAAAGASSSESRLAASPSKVQAATSSPAWADMNRFDFTQKIHGLVDHYMVAGTSSDEGTIVSSWGILCELTFSSPREMDEALDELARQFSRVAHFRASWAGRHLQFFINKFLRMDYGIVREPIEGPAPEQKKSATKSSQIPSQARKIERRHLAALQNLEEKLAQVEVAARSGVRPYVLRSLLDGIGRTLGQVRNASPALIEPHSLFSSVIADIREHYDAAQNEKLLFTVSQTRAAIQIELQTRRDQPAAPIAGVGAEHIGMDPAVWKERTDERIPLLGKPAILAFRDREYPDRRDAIFPEEEDYDTVRATLESDPTVQSLKYYYTDPEFSKAFGASYGEGGYRLHRSDGKRITVILAEPGNLKNMAHAAAEDFRIASLAEGRRPSLALAQQAHDEINQIAQLHFSLEEEPFNNADLEEEFKEAIFFAHYRPLWISTAWKLKALFGNEAGKWSHRLSGWPVPAQYHDIGESEINLGYQILKRMILNPFDMPSITMTILRFHTSLREVSHGDVRRKAIRAVGVLASENRIVNFLYPWYAHLIELLLTFLDGSDYELRRAAMISIEAVRKSQWFTKGYLPIHVRQQIQQKLKSYADDLSNDAASRARARLAILRPLPRGAEPTPRINDQNRDIAVPIAAEGGEKSHLATSAEATAPLAQSLVHFGQFWNKPTNQPDHLPRGIVYEQTFFNRLLEIPPKNRLQTVAISGHSSTDPLQINIPTGFAVKVPFSHSQPTYLASGRSVHVNCFAVLGKGVDAAAQEWLLEWHYIPASNAMFNRAELMLQMLPELTRELHQLHLVISPRVRHDPYMNAQKIKARLHADNVQIFFRDAETTARAIVGFEGFGFYLERERRDKTTPTFSETVDSLRSNPNFFVRSWSDRRSADFLSAATLQRNTREGA